MSQLTRNALLALVITLALIGTIAYTVHYLNQARVAQLNDISNQLATDTLSIETQFTLLETAPCDSLERGTSLSQEVSDLGDRLNHAESQLGNDDPQVIELKKQYTLLQIRDYLLTKRVAATCGYHPTIALYFYSNEKGACPDCDRASYALSYLHDTYPALRVYSFDYNLDLGALQTLEDVVKVKPQFPAFVIDGTPSYGFTDLDTFKTSFPQNLFATSTASSTATSTTKKK